MDKKIVLGVFQDRNNAENVINNLQNQGYDPKDVSIVMKNSSQAREMAGNTGADVASGTVSGATTGAIVGGIAGLVAAFVLPGLGAIFIGGPIAAALGLTGAAATTVSGATTGAVAGGLLGALSGWGLSEDDARMYQQRVEQGGILVAVPSLTGDEANVRNMLTSSGADQVRVLDTGTSPARNREDYENQSSPAYYSDVRRENRQKMGNTADEDIDDEDLDDED